MRALAAAAVRHSVAMIAMSKQRRQCVNNPDLFCYICGDNTLKRSQNPVTEFIQKTYLAYFGISIRIQDEARASHIVCKALDKKVKNKNEIWFSYDMA